MQRLSLFCLAILLTACSVKPRELPLGFRDGEFKVAYYHVEPDSEKRAQDPEYTRAKEMLNKRLPPLLASRGNGREVGMTISIIDVSYEMNAWMASLANDSYRIHSKVTLWDAATKRPLIEGFVSVQHGGAGGPLALLGDPVFTEAELIEKMESSYLKDIMNFAYPYIAPK